MRKTSSYDYIIAGAGCAGLSLVMHLIQSGSFSDKQILLIDKEEKNTNDRTWCFWEKEEGLFDVILYNSWPHLLFSADGFQKIFSISPYHYKMIRSGDFYRHCFEEISRQVNITVIFENVESISTVGEKAEVRTGDGLYYAEYVFNSILFEKPVLKKNQYWLLQHFKGWEVETAENSFNPAIATLMDFCISQQYGCSFVYVMPFTGNRALVEFTLFSKELIMPEQYDAVLSNYLIENLGIRDYRVTREESGIIPMTNYRFPVSNGRIINIGTAGGQTKASSGYTFRNIQKHASSLVKSLVEKGMPGMKKEKKRFMFYDSVLLNILYHDAVPGKKIFTDLFSKNKIEDLLQFLDNESSLKQELRIISSLPVIPFLKAAARQI